MNTIQPVFGGTKNSKSKKHTAAVIGGTAAGGVAGLALKRASSLILCDMGSNKMKAVHNSVDDSKISEIKKGVKKAYNASGLKDKGVHLFMINENNAPIVEKFIRKNLDNMPDIEKHMAASEQVQEVLSGVNSYYDFGMKSILTADSKSGLFAAFHEMGHALNDNMSKTFKSLQRMRNISILAAPIWAISLLKTKKKDGEKPKNKLDAAGDFIKKHAAALTALVSVPTLIEEGVASLKGNKLAREVLDPVLASKVKQTNKYAYYTYLAYAGASCAGVFAANKVKDAIVEKSDKKMKNTQAVVSA